MDILKWEWDGRDMVYRVEHLGRKFKVNRTIKEDYVVIDVTESLSHSTGIRGKTYQDAIAEFETMITYLHFVLGYKSPI